MNFTYNNHLTYSIGNNLFGERTNPHDSFTVDIGSVNPDIYMNGDYNSELDRVAELVYNDLGNDLVLMFSGGTDSEIVLRSFLRNGYKPQCAIVRFKNDYNLHDVLIAESVCKELGLNLHVIDYDIENFLYSGEVVEFSKILQCTQITYLMVYDAILKMGKPAIMGGEVFLRRHTSLNCDSFWYYCFRENEDASAMRFSLKYNIPLVNEYFSYTPELLLHYLEQPEIHTLVTTKYNYKLSSVSSKNQLLTKLVPDITLRKKTHGFEQLLAFNHEAYRLLSKHQTLRLESNLDGIEFNDILSRLKKTL